VSAPALPQTRWLVLLDSGPLGLVTNPKTTPDSLACRAWSEQLILDGHRLLVPEVTDYELRRELRLYNRVNGIRNLDTLKVSFGYVPLTTAAMLRAAEFWAKARKTGMPTADRLALDGDVILAAQAATLNPDDWTMTGASVVIATMNVGHLSRFTPALRWQDITS